MSVEHNSENFWDHLQAARTQRIMTGIDPLAPPGKPRDWTGELARAKVVNLRAMSSRERTAYFLKVASNLG